MAIWSAAGGVFSSIVKLFSELPKNIVAEEATDLINRYARGRITVKSRRETVYRRAEVVEDMVRIERLTGNNLPNLKGWLKEADEFSFPFSENKVMNLMSEIERTRRPTVYVTWDSGSRDEFIEVLRRLDNDVIAQNFRLALEKVKPVWERGKQWRETVAKPGIAQQAINSAARRQAAVYHRSLVGGPPTIAQSTRRILFWFAVIVGLILVLTMFAE